MNISLNGRIIKSQDARIPAVQSALYYGTGCFETVRADSGKFLHFVKHCERLKNGLAWLGADPDDIPDARMLYDDTGLLLEANQLQDKIAKVRIQAFPEDSPGYGKRQSPPVSILITAEPYQPAGQPIRVCTVSTRTIPGISRPAELKLSNMLHYRNAYREAEKQGFDDGLLLNIEGYIAETSIANIFWRKGDEISTPSANCDLLPGIMRSVVIDLVENMDRLILKEGKLLPELLKEADEAWVTNSVKELVWLKEVDGKRYKTDSEFKKKLQSKFSWFKNENLS